MFLKLRKNFLSLSAGLLLAVFAVSCAPKEEKGKIIKQPDGGGSKPVSDDERVSSAVYVLQRVREARALLSQAAMPTDLVEGTNCPAVTFPPEDSCISRVGNKAQKWYLKCYRACKTVDGKTTYSGQVEFRQETSTTWTLTGRIESTDSDGRTIEELDIGGEALAEGGFRNISYLHALSVPGKVDRWETQFAGASFFGADLNPLRLTQVSLLNAAGESKDIYFFLRPNNKEIRLDGSCMTPVSNFTYYFYKDGRTGEGVSDASALKIGSLSYKWPTECTSR